MSRVFLPLALCISAACLSLGARTAWAAPPTYSVTPAPNIPARFNTSQAALNRDLTVVGIAAPRTGDNKLFVWQARTGEVSYVAAPLNSRFTVVNGVNARNEAVGLISVAQASPDGGTSAFYLSPERIARGVHLSERTRRVAVGNINDAGDVPAEVAIGGVSTRNVIWNTMGVDRSLPELGRLQSINQAGWMAGYEYAGGMNQPFVASPQGVRTWLPVPAGLTQGAVAQSLNDAGQVVGYGSTGQYRALLWQAGTVTDLGLLPGFASCLAHRINQAGTVLGDCSRLANPSRAGWVWTAAEGMHSLLERVDPADPMLPGIVSLEGTDVNDDGVIVANAQMSTPPTFRVVLLTPRR